MEPAGSELVEALVTGNARRVQYNHLEVGHERQ